jgi:hypothetical protein
MFTHKLYEVVTLFECFQNPATRDWLWQNDPSLPDEIPPGRYPAPGEVVDTIERLHEIRGIYLVSKNVWQVSLIHRKDVSWAVLAVRDYIGNPEVPHGFDFIAGWDEMIELVASRLARVCGPLVLLPDSGAVPKVLM